MSPSAAIAAAGGPRKRIPDVLSLSAVGSSGFSDAWPLQADIELRLDMQTIASI